MNSETQSRLPELIPTLGWTSVDRRIRYARGPHTCGRWIILLDHPYPGDSAAVAQLGGKTFSSMNAAHQALSANHVGDPPQRARMGPSAYSVAGLPYRIRLMPQGWRICLLATLMNSDEYAQAHALLTGVYFKRGMDALRELVDWHEHYSAQ